MEDVLKISEKILKQVGIALNTAKLYPPGHPMFEKMVEESLKLLNEFPSNYPTLSFYFLENTVIVEKEKLDISKIPAIQALIKYFSRVNIKSLSIDSDSQRIDWESFYKMLSIPVKELKEVKDLGVLLHQLGAERVRVNDVEFGIISTRQKVEIKFDMDSVVENIKKGERISQEAAHELFKETTGIPVEDISRLSKEEIIQNIQKFEKNIYEKYGFIEPEKLSFVIAEIFENLSPDLRNDILGDMMDIEELRSMAKEIIRNLPEEELINFIISRGEKGEEIIEFLPEDKRGEVMTMISAGKGKGTGTGTGTGTGHGKGEGIYTEKPGAGLGFGGEGIISKEMEQKLSKLYTMLKTETEESKIKSEIAKFLNDLIGADYAENPEKVPVLLDSLKTIAAFLLERYGMDAFEDFSLLGSHVLSLLTPDIKRNVYEYLSKTKEMADVIRSVLPTLPDEELLSLFAGRVKNFPEETDEIVKSLPENKVSILQEKEMIEGGFGKPFSPSRKLLEIERLARESHLVITGEKRFEAMKKELEEGIRTAEVDSMIEPFIQGINSDDPAQRKYSVNGIGSLLISFLKTNKIRLAKRLLNFFEENIKKEEDIEVFFTYLEYLEKGYTLAKEKNLADFIEFFEAEFKKLLDLSEKRRFVLKTLGKTGTDFALRMLLTTLWEEESVDEIKDALIPLGDKAAQELLKLFPEIDNLVVRKRILELLISLPAWDTNHLKELLFDKRWSVQRDVIYLIGEKKVTEMIPFIEELALKGQDIVRKEAVRALGKIKTSDAEEILVKALDDKNEEIKKEAVKSLCSNITDTILPRIREYFKDSVESFKEENTPVLVEILKGLKKRKDKKIIPFLFKIIEEKKLFGRPSYPPLLRREAVKTLAEFDEDTDIINRLKNFTNDSDSEIRAFLKVFFAKHGTK